MQASRLFQDPRYAALMATARAMLEQRAIAEPHASEHAAARRLEPVLPFAQSDSASFVDQTHGGGELKAPEEA
jgi:hypothetical protein